MADEELPADATPRRESPALRVALLLVAFLALCAVGVVTVLLPELADDRQAEGPGETPSATEASE